jgi:uncharacterized membrane protein YqjE
VDYQGRTSAALDDRREHFEASERPISGILQDIKTNIQEIVQAEIKLAKIELTDTASRVRSASTMFGTGGVLGIYAVGFCLLAAMMALEIVLPGWLASLIVGVLAGIGALIAISQGRQVLKTVRAPEKTIQTVREDLLWTKEQAKS